VLEHRVRCGVQDERHGRRRQGDDDGDEQHGPEQAHEADARRLEGHDLEIARQPPAAEQDRDE